MFEGKSCSHGRAFTSKVRDIMEVVIALNVRRNQLEVPIFAFRVRRSSELHGWYRPRSEGIPHDGWKCVLHLLHCEIPVVMKRSRTLEMVSNLHRKILALNVRRDGPQPSIFVRSFNAITRKRIEEVCPLFAHVVQ